MKPRNAAAAVLLALTLTACADDPGVTGEDASTAPSQTQSQAQTPSAGPATGSSAPTVPAGATLVTFTRQGGIAGVNDRLTVSQDGTYTAQTRGGTRNGKLGAQELAALKAALSSVDFAKVPSVNDNGGTIADGFTYSIVYNGREIAAEDGAIPPALQPIFGTLSAILSQ